MIGITRVSLNSTFRIDTIIIYNWLKDLGLSADFRPLVKCFTELTINNIYIFGGIGIIPRRIKSTTAIRTTSCNVST